MDKREFTVIENETMQKQDVLEKTSKPSRATNPIARKFAEFHNDKKGKFSVKDLFKRQ